MKGNTMCGFVLTIRQGDINCSNHGLVTKPFMDIVYTNSDIASGKESSVEMPHHHLELAF